mgnify:CR=1 FL=1
MRALGFGGLATAIVLALGAGAEAQTRIERLFISPVGQPFRTADGSAPILLWFAGVDADADGKLSRDEFAANAMAFFGSTDLDANGDRSITSIESTALLRAQAPEVLSTRMDPVPRARERDRGMVTPRTERSHGEAASPLRGAAAFSLLGDVEPVMSCDTDLSRRVTAPEFEACALRRFAVLDSDGDGFFSLADSVRAAELMAPPTDQ